MSTSAAPSSRSKRAPPANARSTTRSRCGGSSRRARSRCVLKPGLITVKPGNRSLDPSLRGPAKQPDRKTASALNAAEAACAFGRSVRSLAGSGSPACGVVAIHHGATARADIGALLVHAGGDTLHVGDFMAAQPHGVAGAHLLGVRRQGGAGAC